MHSGRPFLCPVADPPLHCLLCSSFAPPSCHPRSSQPCVNTKRQCRASSVKRQARGSGLTNGKHARARLLAQAEKPNIRRVVHGTPICKETRSRRGAAETGRNACSSAAKGEPLGLRSTMEMSERVLRTTYEVREQNSSITARVCAYYGAWNIFEYVQGRQRSYGACAKASKSSSHVWASSRRFEESRPCETALGPYGEAPRARGPFG